MPEFRYAQFCPVARAAELLGERWTLPIIRELLIAPQRFSDLKRRLPGVSSSVLSQRLQRLELRGVIARRVLEPPAASSVFELTPLGEALREPVLGLARWGLALLSEPAPGDHFEPSWIQLGLEMFASAAPSSPGDRFELQVVGAGREATVRIAGGPEGTRVERWDDPVSAVPLVARLRAEPLVFLALVTGQLDPDAAQTSAAIEVDGKPESLRRFLTLFDP
jgi:DNA-binding HxlR family transcriptional regulator